MVWKITGTGASKPVADAYPAAAAFSLRSLTAGNPAVVRVRRSIDDAEQDFTAQQVNDGSLLTFCGAGSGFIRTWYDQTGKGMHMHQTTNANQPQIVANGTAIVSGSRPSVDFDSGRSLASVSPIAFSGACSIFTLVNFLDTVTSTGTLSTIWTSDGGKQGGSFAYGGDYAAGFTNERLVWASDNASNGDRGYAYTASNITGGNYLYSNFFDGSSAASIFSNGSQMTLVTAASGAFISLRRQLNIQKLLNGRHRVSELLIYSSYQLSNRSAIESNINAYYGIY